MKRNIWKFLMVLALILCVLPMAAFADDATHEHVWNPKVQTNNPACGEYYTYQQTCSYDGCMATLDTTGSMKTHSWNDGTVIQEATCGVAGSRHFVCQNGCGLETTETIAALTHNWDEGTVQIAATCETAGTKLYKCQNQGCLLKEVEQAYELGHDWKVTEHVAAICGTAGHTTSVCQRAECQKEKTDIHAALRHYWDEGKVVKAATCTEKGSKEYTCQNPGCPLGKVVQPYDALDHLWDEGKITTAATCGKAGVKTYTCTRDTGHTRTEAIPATGAHRLSIALSNSEYHWQYCWNDGCEYVTTGYHDWSRWRVARKATEEKDGLLRKDCAWCSQKKWSSYEYSDNPPTTDAVIFPAMVMLMSAAALPAAVHQSKKNKKR